MIKSVFFNGSHSEDIANYAELKAVSINISSRASFEISLAISTLSFLALTLARWNFLWAVLISSSTKLESGSTSKSGSSYSYSSFNALSSRVSLIFAFLVVFAFSTSKMI